MPRRWKTDEENSLEVGSFPQFNQLYRKIIGRDLWSKLGELQVVPGAKELFFFFSYLSSFLLFDWKVKFLAAAFDANTINTILATNVESFLNDQRRNSPVSHLNVSCTRNSSDTSFGNTNEFMFNLFNVVASLVIC